jgi:hypothetical protein
MTSVVVEGGGGGGPPPASQWISTTFAAVVEIDDVPAEPSALVQARPESPPRDCRDVPAAP